ncbi:hypothetical protein A2U01_0011328, partial [Trifolium medium]|nr:hypothetical protein [Trifolium medium]
RKPPKNGGNACVDAGTNEIVPPVGLHRKTSGRIRNCTVKKLKGPGSSSNVPLVIDDDADDEAEDGDQIDGW